MTISTAASRVSFVCNGLTTVFPIPIQAYLATDFTAILTAPVSAGGASTVLTLNSQYTLASSGTLQPPQWTLTTQGATSPFPNGYTLQVFCNPVQTQQTQYVAGQAFPSLAVQTNFDRLTQMVQRLQDQLNRTVLAPDVDAQPLMALPPAAGRALMALVFDVNGNTSLGAIPTTAFTQGNFNAFLSLAWPSTPTTQQTQAEVTAGITPTNYAYAPGDVRRYGATPGSGDSTAAFQSAAAVQAVDNGTVNIGGGIYNITPTATIQMTGDWVGAGTNKSQVIVNLTALAASTPVFQLQGNHTAHDFTLTGTGVSPTQHGLYLSNPVVTSFTGGQRVTKLVIQGFNNGLMLGNVFNVVLDQLNITGNAVGVYCQPSQYVASITFRDCFLNANGQNAFFNTPVNSMGVSFIGGAIQDSGTTGTGSAQAYFNNIFDLEFAGGVYGEGNSSNPWLYFASVGPVRIGGAINNGAGGILVGSGQNCQLLIENTLFSSGVLNIGTGNQLTLLNSIFPVGGNTLPPQTYMRNVRVNGFTPQSTVTGFGSPTGAVVVANFPGATATLLQTSETVAQILTIMKANGDIGA